MEITLRKAALIQTEIGQYLSKNIRTVPNVAVGIFQDPQEVLNDAQTNLNLQISKYLSLVECRADIRRLVGRANIDSLVSDMLADVAAINQKIEFIENIISQTRSPALRVAEISARLEKLQSEESHYGGDGVMTPVLSKSMLGIYNDELAKLKRDKSNLQEKITERNSFTKITLPHYTVEVLQTYGFV